MAAISSNLAHGVLLVLVIGGLLALRSGRRKIQRGKAESALHSGELQLAESLFERARDLDGLSRVGDRYLEAEHFDDAYRVFSRAGRTETLRFFAEETQRDVCLQCSGAGERYLSSDEASSMVPWNMCDYSRAYEIGQLTEEAVRCPDCAGSGYHERLVKVFSPVVQS